VQVAQFWRRLDGDPNRTGSLAAAGGRQRERRLPTQHFVNFLERKLPFVRPDELLHQCDVRQVLVPEPQSM
jgi:hypothetical protein